MRSGTTPIAGDTRLPLLSCQALGIPPDPIGTRDVALGSSSRRPDRPVFVFSTCRITCRLAMLTADLLLDDPSHIAKRCSESGTFLALASRFLVVGPSL